MFATRRALLGGLAALPLAGAFPTVARTRRDEAAAEAVLRQRVAARHAAGNDASEADVAVLQRQIDHHEPLGDDERAIALDVATDAAVDADALAARWLAGA